MSLDEEARRGDEARRIVEDPLVQEALRAIREEIISQWSQTPARDSEAREWIWRHYKVVEKFEGLLRSYIESGRFARLKLQEEESRLERFKQGARRMFA
jgi:hypothetical protein